MRRELKVKTMNKYLFYTTPILISCIWLVVMNHTFNPLSLKGPDFLKFYLILIFGCYASLFALQALKESSSKTTFYFMISIFLLGVVKLIKGILLGKPVGFLIIILVMEIIIVLFVNADHVNHKIK